MAETNEVRGLTQEEIKAACGYENLQINIFLSCNNTHSLRSNLPHFEYMLNRNESRGEYFPTKLNFFSLCIYFFT